MKGQEGQAGGEELGFIPVHGGYENLFSYQRAKVVYKGTVYFVKRWAPRISRTTDQMVQAARSGKQNIVEGSVASAVSKETEIKLTGVALASLAELLEDYRDYLYVNDIPEWKPSDKLARRLSQLCRSGDPDYETFRKAVEHDDPGISANALAGLTRVAMRLLEGQLDRLQRDFVQEGGLRERMTRARLVFREQARATGAARDQARSALANVPRVPQVPLKQ
jgi:four helix bundle suffix protein